MTVSSQEAVLDLDDDVRILSIEMGQSQIEDWELGKKDSMADLFFSMLDRDYRTHHPDDLSDIPASDEKLKYLSKTRPPWLPPKSKAEEQEHLRQFRKILKQSIDTREKEKFKAQEALQNKDKLANEFTYLWESYILPNWRNTFREQRVHRLVRKYQTPTRCRGKIWRNCFGNILELDQNSFELALKRAKIIEDKLSSFVVSDYNDTVSQKIITVDKSLISIFPDSKLFETNSPFYDDLRELIFAYAFYRPDVFISRSIASIGAILLTSLSKKDAFIALCNLLNRPFLLAFYLEDQAKIKRFYGIVDQLFAQNLPSLYIHFTLTLSLNQKDYVLPLAKSLFTTHAPISIAARVLDVYAFEGDSFLPQAIVGAFSFFEHRLYGSKEEVLEILGWEAKQWQIENDEYLTRAILNVKLSNN